MSLEELFNQVDNLNNNDFEALINHIDRQKKKRARDILSEAQRQAEVMRSWSWPISSARLGW